MGSGTGHPSLPVSLARLALKIGIVVLVVYGTLELLEWASEQSEMANSQGVMIGILAVLLVAYAVLIAVPFMPGIEVGVSLLMLKGASIAPLVYAATVLGLLLAFFVGRLMPYAWVHRLFADLRLRRASDMLARLEPLSRQERMDLLTTNAPKWLAPVLRSGRYVALALLLNLPGNAFIGGGGGIAFLAGFSRLFRPIVTIFAIMIAVLPVPLAVYLSGSP